MGEFLAAGIAYKIKKPYSNRLQAFKWEFLRAVGVSRRDLHLCIFCTLPQSGLKGHLVFHWLVFNAHVLLKEVFNPLHINTIELACTSRCIRRINTNKRTAIVLYMLSGYKSMAICSKSQLKGTFVTAAVFIIADTFVPAINNFGRAATCGTKSVPIQPLQH